MRASESARIPSYRRYKPTGQAVVTLGGRDHYLGLYGILASRAEYDSVPGSPHDGAWRCPTERLHYGATIFAAGGQVRPKATPPSEKATRRREYGD